MGVDCSITLPPDVRVRDVAEVIGILMGCPKSWHKGDNTKWVDVEGVEVKSSSIPECCEITINPPEGESRWFLFHHECTGGSKGILPRCRANNIAMAVGLVKFFGGSVDFNDSDTTDVDFKRRKPRKTNHPETGKPWSDFQEAMFALEPLTDTDIAKYDKYAAYK